MNNQFISLDKWTNIVKQSEFTIPFNQPNHYGHHVTYYMGHPVYYVHGGVLIWKQCKYCGTKENAEISLFGFMSCSKCGAPIYDN